MKTAEEKARKLLSGEFNIKGKLYDNLFPALTILLKEQDRDTRHACAAAANATQLTVSQCSTTDYCIAYNKGCHDAERACMNVRAV